MQADEPGDASNLAMRVGRRTADGTVPIELEGDLDMDATFTFEPALERHIAEDGTERIVLDLTGVDFMDSAGLGALLSTRERAELLGVELRVAGASDTVMRVLEITGTTRLLGE
jgi:anti-sigma B factor antagonist